MDSPYRSGTVTYRAIQARRDLSIFMDMVIVTVAPRRVFMGAILGCGGWFVNGRIPARLRGNEIQHKTEADDE